MHVDGEFEECYRQHYARVRAICFRRLGDAASADDATSEVFRVAWQHHLSGHEVSPGWLFTVVRNVVSSEYRRRTRARELENRLAHDCTASRQDDEREYIRDLVARLSPSHREVLYLTYWEGLPADRVAQELDTSVAAVWTRLKRARHALASTLLAR